MALLATNLPGAELPPHERLYDPPYLEGVTPWESESAAATFVPVAGQPFERALRIVNRKRMSQFYDAQVTVPLDKAVRAGELLLVQFQARGEAPLNETGEAEVQVYFQKSAPDYEKDLSRHLSIGGTWRTYSCPFSVSRDRGPGEAALCFGTGFNVQTLELAEVRLLRFEPGVKKHQLPTTPLAYPGMAEDAPWRAQAEARIRQHRMADLDVLVTDGDGRPVPGARIEVEMQRHAYPFASIISVRRLLSEGPDGDTYRAKMVELFNASGTENALKWPPWDGSWGAGWSREQTLAALGWLRQQGFLVRGHVMVWPSWRNLPESVRSLQNTAPEEIPGRVLAHIREIAEATRGRVDEWDVLNEPRTNHDLMDRFGREIMVDWFRCAREALPSCDLYINDFGILNGGGPGTPVHETYKETIRFLLDRGAPVTGIGLQGHIGSRLNDPALVYRILDDFATFGLKLKITEFDIDMDDEATQALYTRDILTAVFSHPATVGFQMWGFWEGSHWKPNGAMYRRNWEEKPNGAAYRDLVFRRWWTRENPTADAQGRARVRGFLGHYRVTARMDHAAAEQTLSLQPEGGQVTLVLRP